MPFFTQEAFIGLDAKGNVVPFAMGPSPNTNSIITDLPTATSLLGTGGLQSIPTGPMQTIQPVTVLVSW